MESTILKLLELAKEMRDGIDEILSDPEPEFANWEANMIAEYRRMLDTLNTELASIKG